MGWWLAFGGDGFDGDVPVRGLALRDRRLVRLCYDSWTGDTIFHLRRRLEDWWVDLHIYRRRRATLTASASRVAAAEIY